MASKESFFMMRSNVLPRLSTFAGSGVSGFTDGPGTSATFSSNVQGLAIDGAGNLYVSDLGNNSIRKVTPEGVVSTLFRCGGEFQNEGLRGIAADASGTVYATDCTSGNRIWKISASGTLSHFAHINVPLNVAVDSAGTAYVSAWGAHGRDAGSYIHKVTREGVVSLFAGGPNRGFADGPGASALFDDPRGLAVDAAGNLYVADAGNHCIRKIDTSGNVSTFAGSSAGFADGAGRAAKFNQPHSLAIDRAGNLYVGDLTNQRLRKVTPDGVVSTIAGDGTAGSLDGSPGRVDHPNGVAVNAAGDVFCTGGARVRMIRAAPPRR